jgi:hypothetical protein
MRTMKLAPAIRLALLATAITPGGALAQRPGAASVPAQAEVTFTVKVENVSRRTLLLPNGNTTEIPLSPGVWAVHTGRNPILTPGEVEPGVGLKGLAEAGMALAFAPNLKTAAGVRAADAFREPLGQPRRRMSTNRAEGGGANVSRMLMAGQRFEFTFTARPGDRLSLALMNAQSNDGVIANGAEGIALFDAAGSPISGDITGRLSLWDVGTEVNEEPGAGRNQGLRQGASHAGDPERRAVRPMRDAEFGDRWPAVDQIVKVQIAPKK